MPWNRQGIVTAGGATASLAITSVTATTCLATITVPSGTLVNWTLEIQAGAGAWTTYATGLTALTQTITGLNPETQYSFRASAVISEVAVSASQTITTSVAPVRFIRRTGSYPVAGTNGMFMDIEPLESASVGIIAAPGRTISSQFDWLCMPSDAVGRVAYGFRVMLGNISLSPISGGRLVVGRSSYPTGNWTPNTGGGPTPTEANAITGNLMTGWQTATIGGDPTLPIPAAVARASGMPLMCKWTDWMPIPGGQVLDTYYWAFFTRFLLPPRSTAPYALTYGQWPVESYGRIGTFAGRSDQRMRILMAGGGGAWTEEHRRAEGDYVTNPATAGNFVTASGRCPPEGENFVENSFGQPGPTHSPLLAIEYSLDPLGA